MSCSKAAWKEPGRALRSKQSNRGQRTEGKQVHRSREPRYKETGFPSGYSGKRKKVPESRQWSKETKSGQEEMMVLCSGGGRGTHFGSRRERWRSGKAWPDAPWLPSPGLHPGPSGHRCRASRPRAAGGMYGAVGDDLGLAVSSEYVCARCP